MYTYALLAQFHQEGQESCYMALILEPLLGRQK